MYDLLIEKIEEAMGFKLYDHQRAYVLHNHAIMGGRNVGRTTAYCIRLALSTGEPLNMKKPEEFSDRQGIPGSTTYSRGYFKHHFLEIRDKLKDVGFKVRDVKF